MKRNFLLVSTSHQSSLHSKHMHKSDGETIWIHFIGSQQIYSENVWKRLCDILPLTLATWSFAHNASTKSYNLLFFLFCFFRLLIPVSLLIRLSFFSILIFQYVLYFACIYRHVYIHTQHVYSLPYLKALQQEPVIEYEGWWDSSDTTGPCAN
jgi:hypothetical protein